MRKNKLPPPPLDMCNGAVIPAMLRFAVPLMLSGVLQLLYNAADLIVVGRFSADGTALAAVGACSTLITLLVNAFIGLAVGANVVIARALGAADTKRASSATHTAITISVLLGLFVCIVTLLFADTFLAWMGTPAELRRGAALYLRIYACGFPASLLYNFGAAVLRACGDTRRPMYFLMTSGLANVLFNLLFVIVFGMSSDGVALATVVSQVISAVLVVLALTRTYGPCQLFFKRLSIRWNDLAEILKIGIPACIQSACFSISNVLIQSSINSFGAVAIAGNTAAGNIEGFIYTCFNAISQSCLSFIGQNVGANKIRRIPRIMGAAFVLSTVFSLVTAVLCLSFATPLLSQYTTDAAAIEFGIERMWMVGAVYFLCAWMEILSNSLRAMGVSVMPMITCILGVCGVRVAWIYTIFQQFHTPTVLFSSYPVTWIITILVLGVAFLFIYRKMSKTAPPLAET